METNQTTKLKVQPNIEPQRPQRYRKGSGGRIRHIWTYIDIYGIAIDNIRRKENRRKQEIKLFVGCRNRRGQQLEKKPQNVKVQHPFYQHDQIISKKLIHVEHLVLISINF
jgi:hypothetical protein